MKYWITEVDFIDEFKDIVSEIGFKITNMTFAHNYCAFVLKK